MSKGAVAIAVIALLLGAAGIGLGFMGMYQKPSGEPLAAYLLLTQAEPGLEVLESWWTYYDGLVSVTGSAYVSILTMDTTIIVPGDSNVSLYLCFNSEAHIVSGNNAYLAFYLDGFQQNPQITFSGLDNITVCLQAVISNVTPGSHLVQVYGKVDGGDTFYLGGALTGFGLSLFIQALAQ